MPVLHMSQGEETYLEYQLYINPGDTFINGGCAEHVAFDASKILRASVFLHVLIVPLR